jgi:hypothetical protein
MPLIDEHEERKVQDALALIRENLGMKAMEAARQMRASYSRVLHRLKGVVRSSIRGGHNKKLNEPETKALKGYLLMCHKMGRGAGIESTIAAANTILRYQGSHATAYRRSAKDWLTRNRKWIKTFKTNRRIHGKPLPRIPTLQKPLGNT